MAVVGSLKVKTFLSATSLVTKNTIIIISIIIIITIITIIIILTIFSSTLAMMHWVTGYHPFVIWGLRQLQCSTVQTAIQKKDTFYQCIAKYGNYGSCRSTVHTGEGHNLVQRI